MIRDPIRDATRDPVGNPVRDPVRDPIRSDPDFVDVGINSVRANINILLLFFLPLLVSHLGSDECL